jgi:hypothetical protein
MDTVNLTTDDLAPDTSTEERLPGKTRHSLLCSRTDICPLAWTCPNTGTDSCDSGEGCPAC